MHKISEKKQRLKNSIERIKNAFAYSYDGFVSILKSEASFRQEMLLFVVLMPMVFILDISNTQRALLLFSLWFILFAEGVNTAIEVCIDRISKEQHPLSKKAKDIGSLTVLLAFINAICIWTFVLL
ncbi:MAG: diacylglycerol kinase [Alphaproteobacteria bacterium]|nr:diacylglycerol kinase [Alphaproteobacteria bacterium]